MPNIIKILFGVYICSDVFVIKTFKNKNVENETKMNET